MNFLEQCLFKYFKSLISKKWWFGSQAARQGPYCSSETTGALQWAPEKACGEWGTNEEEVEEAVPHSRPDWHGWRLCSVQHSLLSAPSALPQRILTQPWELWGQGIANTFGEDETFAWSHRAKDERALPPRLALGSSAHVWTRDAASQDSSWPQQKALRWNDCMTYTNHTLTNKAEKTATTWPVLIEK